MPTMTMPTGRLTTVCASCLALLNEVSPMPESRLSHGVCRYHELRALVENHQAGPDELREYAEYARDTIRIVAEVPRHVAAAIGQLVVDNDRKLPFEQVAGLALTREVNRASWERPKALALAVKVEAGA